MLGQFTGRNVPRIQRLGWGRMWIARRRNIYTYEGEPWGFDNGAYGDYLAGREFDERLFLKAFDRAVVVDSLPTVAVLPDKVGGGAQSLDMSLGWIEKLDVPVGWPWYLAVQDGMEPGSFVVPNGVVGIFLGGTNEYKARAGEWCEWAHSQGLRFHYGRAGIAEKIAHALDVGADSLDSAFPMWTMTRWRFFEECITQGPPQGDLFRGAVE